ncbi:MAG: hypothetical protein AAF328_00710 [Planctomycetota bacterium]
MAPIPPADPNLEKPPTLPIDINDQDPSTRGGPPGWIAFSIIAGVFVVGIFVMFLLFGVLT